MDDLIKILRNQKFQSESFSPDFTASVMAKVRNMVSREVKIISMWQKRMWKIAAACFVGCLLSLYALDGTISVDSVLGLSEYSDLEISQSYDTYQTWDAELK